MRFPEIQSTSDLTRMCWPDACGDPTRKQLSSIHPSLVFLKDLWPVAATLKGEAERIRRRKQSPKLPPKPRIFLDQVQSAALRLAELLENKSGELFYGNLQFLIPTVGRPRPEWTVSEWRFQKVDVRGKSQRLFDQASQNPSCDGVASEARSDTSLCALRTGDRRQGDIV